MMESPSRGVFILQSPSRLLVVAAIGFGLSLACGGCLMLAVPEVAYEGYKYEHNKNAKPTLAPTPAGASVERQPSRAIDDSIE